jgi:hypothetical protein
MKIVYCANCGTRLSISRKALPKYGVIVDIVEYHECPDKPVEFDLKPVDIPTFNEKEGKNKFVQKLNELSPPTVTGIFGGVSSNDLRDRRFESEEPTPNTPRSTPKSSAPPGVFDLLKSLEPTPPAGDLTDPETESEK